MAAKGAGRKSIPMEKIEDPSKLGVTFSKRWSGLFKKACAGRLLCDCHTAIVIFSEANKVFSFGDPSTDRILNSFINSFPAEGSDAQQLTEGYDFGELPEDYDFGRLVEEMKEYKSIVKAEKTGEGAFAEVENDAEDENGLGKLWSEPVEELTLEEAEEMLAKLEDFKQFKDTSGNQA